ncbi:MAG: methionine gamma-lyase family protein [Lachnospiraceae bacterium]|nr:methionine gamma-lyase family protein [Lachnospiraceae bacterium]
MSDISFSLTEYYKNFGIEDSVYKLGEEVLNECSDRFKDIDRISELNQIKVLKAFCDNKVSEACLLGTSGYGYNDLGRETLEKVYASVFKTEDAIVRPQITCGTHALSLALSANLRPGDELLSPVGKPYDTLEEVIGIRESKGSLKEYGISYRQVDLLKDDKFDLEGIKQAINDRTKLVTIQRSKGYQTRKSFSVKEIAELIKFIKDVNPGLKVMVDNCYGEFTDVCEPSEFGADMTVGSLIKNPGGGLAPIGGYIVGTKECIENIAYRLTSPGLGREVGASLDTLKSFYQGLFLSPTVSASALKGAIFAAGIYEKLGFECVPGFKGERNDIIQAVAFHDPNKLITFCEAIQAASPIDSFVNPEPWDMPGYDSKVIMAAGTFVSGASIELSADGPLREPYAAYFQGGITWPHVKIGILNTVQALKNKGLIDIK